MSVDAVAMVVKACRALAAAGLTDMVWGHPAIRDPEGRGVWMKAAGWGFEEITASRVVLVSLTGEVLDGTGRRHIEYPIHTEIMRARPEVSATVHTHAPALSAFASLDTPLLPISHDGVLFCDPQIPRFTRTGALISTAELGADLARTIGAAPACLMPNHARSPQHPTSRQRSCSRSCWSGPAGPS
jgi:ribulose-5-phosphate 4-epimerase/fuculose-1-phosphate aldolase